MTLQSFGPLCTAGHALIVSAGFDKASNGSAVTMRRLLSRFDPSSFSIVTYNVPRQELSAGRVGGRRFYVPFGWSVGFRIGSRFREAARPCVERVVTRAAAKLGVKVVVGVYPDLDMLTTAMGVAARLCVPLVVYLHDLLAECYAGGRLQERAVLIQDRAFRQAAKVIAVNVGMAEYLNAHYGLNPATVQIPSDERQANVALPSARGAGTVFIAGTVYGVNAKGIARVVNAARESGLETVLATSTSSGRLTAQGITGPRLRQLHIADRTEYLQTLRTQGALVACLDWPDESPVAREELATAFPTKVVDYLQAGRPIAVHCPSEYFLARFVRDHACGVVFDSRDPETLTKGMHALVAGEFPRESFAGAWEAAEIFSVERLANAFKREVDDAVREL